MKRRTSRTAVVLALAVTFVAVSYTPASADSKRYRAHVFTNRAYPVASVPVDDFRVNETPTDEGGVQYLWLHGPDGGFRVPFELIDSVEVTRYLGLARGNIAQYEVRINGKTDTRTGTIDIWVMRGVSRQMEWYMLPGTQFDRGAGLYRIVFGETPGEPVLPPPPPKAPEPEPPLVPPSAVPVAAPKAPSADDQFADKTLDQLNAENPLLDCFFDFDKSDLRLEAQTVLQRNAQWLTKWPSVKVRVEGYADPRGSNEYNLGLGERRAVSVRDFLVSQGIPMDRIAVAPMGATQVFCHEQTEACWARNRRSHFVLTAK